MKFLRKLAACMTAAVMAVSAFAVGAFAADSKINVDNSITTVKSGQSYTKKIETDTMVVYSLKVKEKKTLTLDINYTGKSILGLVMDDSSKSLKPDKVSATKGNAAAVEVKEGYALAIINDDANGCTGKAVFTLSKGTYMIMFSNYTSNSAYAGSGTLKFTPKVTTPKEETTIERFMIQLKKGSTVQLGTVLSASTTSKVTWSTSDKNVAAVSSAGKITAKKAGTAVITAKLGNSTLKITVKVTDK